MTGEEEGVSFKFTSASVVIQTEVWWSRTAELQALLQVVQPGSKDHVFVYRLFALNSVIDQVVNQVAQHIPATKKTIMSALT